MHRIGTIIAAMLLAGTATVAQAAPADVAGAVAASGRPADSVKLDESRKPAAVLGYLGLEQGQSALDLMTGSGYYAEIIGKAVGPAGSVTAWEPASFYDDKAKKSLAELQTRVPNVKLLVSPAEELALPAESFDLVLMHMVYHDFYWESAQFKWPRLDPDAVLKKVYAATRPGGVVGVVDHVATAGGDTRQVADKLHRIDPAVVRADFERAGFVFDGESDLLRNSGDDHSKLVFDPGVRSRTDRIIYRFRKPRS